MDKPDAIGFVGGGNMGEALIKGIVGSGFVSPGRVFVYDTGPGRLTYLKNEYGIVPAASNAELVKKAGVVVLAVKPQIMDAVLEEIATAVTADHLVISIAAGVTLGRIQAGLRDPVPVIRVMPNTPALVLAGATALAAGQFARPEHLDQAKAIFNTVGKTVVLEEKYLDVATGLSGSGPAYVFLFLEALADGAVAMGLARPEARLLAAQTVLGAAKLALESGKHTGELKDMVTSPGGTTAAGLAVLEKRAFRSAVGEAVVAATLRSKELGLKG